MGECRGRGGEEGRWKEEGEEREELRRGRKRGKTGGGIGIKLSLQLQSGQRLGSYLRFSILGHILAILTGPNSTARFCT